MMFRHIRISRKGSYIIEAALVMPIMILAVITSVMIIIFFYREMSEQSLMHTALMNEAAVSVQGSYFILEEESWDGSIDLKRSLTGGSIYGKKYIVMDNKGILTKKGTFTLEDKYVFIDGTDYVRYCDLLKDGDDE